VLKYDVHLIKVSDRIQAHFGETVWLEKLNARDNLEDLSIDGRII
jgi:hypothetical protein